MHLKIRLAWNLLYSHSNRALAGPIESAYIPSAVFECVGRLNCLFFKWARFTSGLCGIGSFFFSFSLFCLFGRCVWLSACWCVCVCAVNGVHGDTTQRVSFVYNIKPCEYGWGVMTIDASERVICRTTSLFQAIRMVIVCWSERSNNNLYLRWIGGTCAFKWHFLLSLWYIFI